MSEYPKFVGPCNTEWRKLVHDAIEERLHLASIPIIAESQGPTLHIHPPISADPALLTDEELEAQMDQLDAQREASMISKFIAPAVEQMAQNQYPDKPRRVRPPKAK